MTSISKYTSRFKNNFIWLFLVNKLSYLFSFLTLPILISKYGLKEMGVIFTVQSLVLTISIVTNYSFVYYIPTVSKKISLNKKAFSSLWNLTLSTRLILSILLSFISIIIVILYYKNFLFLWLLSLPILIAKIINPVLFCNALEKNNLVFKIVFFQKLLFLLFILLINKSIYVNFFFGFSELIVLLFFLKKIHPTIHKIKFVGFKKINSHLRETFRLFLVNVFSMLKPASIVPIISYLLGVEYVTLYTLADKVMNVVRGVSGAVFVSFFPIFTKENISIRVFLTKKSFFALLLTFLFTLFIWLCSPYLIYYLNNFTKNNVASETLQLLSLSIPSFFIIIPLFSYLLNKKNWTFILQAAIFQLIILYGLVFVFHKNIQQIAVNFVVAEYSLLIFYVLFIFLSKKRELD